MKCKCFTSVNIGHYTPLSLTLPGSGRLYNGRVSRSANLACLSKIYGCLIVKKSSNMYGKFSDMYFLNSPIPILPSIHTFFGTCKGKIKIKPIMQRETRDTNEFSCSFLSMGPAGGSSNVGPSPSASRAH